MFRRSLCPPTILVVGVLLVICAFFVYLVGSHLFRAVEGLESNDQPDASGNEAVDPSGNVAVDPSANQGVDASGSASMPLPAELVPSPDSPPEVLSALDVLSKLSPPPPQDASDNVTV